MDPGVTGMNFDFAFSEDRSRIIVYVVRTLYSVYLFKHTCPIRIWILHIYKSTHTLKEFYISKVILSTRKFIKCSKILWNRISRHIREISMLKVFWRPAFGGSLMSHNARTYIFTHPSYYTLQGGNTSSNNKYHCLRLVKSWLVNKQ